MQTGPIRKNTVVPIDLSAVLNIVNNGNMYSILGCYPLPSSEQRSARCGSENEMQNLAGPKILNAFPSDVRESDSFESYKPRYKTCPFKCALS